MPPESAKLLEDIRDAGEFILARTASLTLDAFQDDRVLRQAVERNFEIIGEAMVRLRDQDATVAAGQEKAPDKLARHCLGRSKRRAHHEPCGKPSRNRRVVPPGFRWAPVGT